MKKAIGADGGMSIDWSDFNSRFFEYALRVAPRAAEDGMFAALSEWKNDCDNVSPKTPHLEGNLRGDFDFILEGITQSKVISSGSKFKGPGAAERFAKKNNIIVRLVFRMPYAAKWHEAVGKKINWSESGVGPKYMESKMGRFARKYYGIVADFVKHGSSVKLAAGNKDYQWDPDDGGNGPRM